ncbi:hypothetical protein [Streptomyces ziwulingensis]|uniref:Uncharacterized protein n=1 Tax=Streptomyces ziwulingensis TaxID=1045501 RepID=A0ABP9AJK1_9ACTN
MTEAQITLAYSHTTGIVAIATGEKYRWAETALEESHFHPQEPGVYHLPFTADTEDTRAAIANLVRCATRHQTSVTTASQPFIGDTAQDIARLLPGQWEATVEIYPSPLSQEYLVSYLWDGGELGQAAQTERIPFIASLTDPTSDITLVLVERPGQRGYLLGAVAPEWVKEGCRDPLAPRSIVLPPHSSRAAKAITNQFLPVYHRAAHSHRSALVSTALNEIRTRHGAWTAMIGTDRHVDAATPLEVDALGVATEEFLDHTWRSFRVVLEHAPVLLARCRPGDSPWPEDAEVLSDLSVAASAAETLRTELDAGAWLTLPRHECNTRMWPAVETWLADSDAFVRQVLLAAPRPGAAVVSSAKLPARPPVRSGPRR